ncbi:hypothetical protein ASH00_12630 [Arthrobacter sp. Soil782]|uniref:hypothetical protein n=1 Tax=Arthrobacter sp. Soil782 TaxID=1736410 RepID=UPI0006F56AC0|nr:hypothetical protein [Arthrobacter sp. Soil782]KRF05236.1 hypothetical protein ASH00_12630 [Arthrobacter sp. Soil782]
MKISDVTWNEQAREKILVDADKALQEAVKEAAAAHSGGDRDQVYKFLFEKLQPQFVDFEPGPDLSEYADAIANGEFSGE